MRILITGAAGFIGSNLAHWLIDNTGHEVYGIDNLSTGYISNYPDSERFLYIHADICDERTLNDFFQGHLFDICFSFAAYAAEGRSNHIRSFIHHNNTVGTANIINACLNYKCKLVFTSSVAVYSGEPPFDENTIPNPIDEYGLSKWASERSIQIAGEQGLDWCIVRPRNVYGERQSLWDSARNVAGIFINQILNNEPITIFGNGSNRRCFTYIGDILEPLYNAAFIPKEIINLGSPLPHTIFELYQLLQKITGYSKVEFLEERHEVKEAYCNTLTSEILLNYKHKTSLEEGLTKMWRWAKQQPKRQMETPPPLEINIKSHSSIK